MNEKRAYGRSPIELAASFGIGEDPRPEREAKINNISSGGFCLISEHKPEMGQEIELAIDLDTTEDVVVPVKVAWVRRIGVTKKFAIGVQIIEMEGPDYDRFVDYYNKTITLR